MNRWKGKIRIPSRFCFLTVGEFEVASLVVAAASTAESISARNQAAAAQEQQFRLQQTQVRLATTEREKARADRLQRIFGTQLAQEAARGISPASPSFKAIQQKSFNAFENDNKADALNLSFKENALSSQIDATRSAARAAEFGSIANFALSSFNQLNLNNPGNLNDQGPVDNRPLPSGPNALPPPFS